MNARVIQGCLYLNFLRVWSVRAIIHEKVGAAYEFGTSADVERIGSGAARRGGCRVYGSSLAASRVLPIALEMYNR